MTAARPILVVLAAGGTAGHVFPAEALAAELGARGCRLALITDRRGGELGGFLGGIETHRVRAGGIAGKSMAARLRSAPELAFGAFQARALLRRMTPDAVIGFGGYASVPTMLAAVFGGYATAVHEQNAVLGRANRLLANRVDRIATSFTACRGVPPEAAARAVHTGMPVRPAVSAAAAPYPPLGPGDPINVLVLGGSQGATVLSRVVPDALARLDDGLRRRLRVVQQCRTEDLEAVRAAHARHGVAAELASFFDDVPERLAAAHLLIGRSGASTLAEAMAVGRPALMVPYPHAIDDHQTANARCLEHAGGGWLMDEAGFTPEALAQRLERLFSAPVMLTQAAAAAAGAGRPDAARRLADMVLDLVPSNGGHGEQTGRKAA